MGVVTSQRSQKVVMTKKEETPKVRNQKGTSQKVTNQPSQKVMLQLLKPSSEKDLDPVEKEKMTVKMERKERNQKMVKTPMVKSQREEMTKKEETPMERSQKVTSQKVTNQKVTNQPSQKEMLQLPNLSLESEGDLDLEEKTKKEEMTKKVVISQRSQR